MVGEVLVGAAGYIVGAIIDGAQKGVTKKSISDHAAAFTSGAVKWCCSGTDEAKARDAAALAAAMMAQQQQAAQQAAAAQQAQQQAAAAQQAQQQAAVQQQILQALAELAKEVNELKNKK